MKFEDTFTWYYQQMHADEIAHKARMTKRVVPLELKNKIMAALGDDDRVSIIVGLRRVQRSLRVARNLMNKEIQERPKWKMRLQAMQNELATLSDLVLATEKRFSDTGELRLGGAGMCTFEVYMKYKHEKWWPFQGVPEKMCSIMTGMALLGDYTSEDPFLLSIAELIMRLDPDNGEYLINRILDSHDDGDLVNE